MELGKDFYARVLRLMRSREADATQELRLLHQEVLDHYEKEGITHKWGVSQTSAPVPAAATDPAQSGMARQRHHDKLVPPPRKAPVVSAAPSASLRPPPGLTPPPQKRPSPAVTPNPPAPPASPPKKPRLAQPEAAPRPKSQAPCSVCKGGEESEANLVIQCHQCSGLLHQRCNRPPVTREQLEDPRWMFCCSRCLPTPAAAASTPSPKPPAKKRRARDEADLFSKMRAEAEVAAAPAAPAPPAAPVSTPSPSGPAPAPISATNLSSMAADFFAKHKGAKAAGPSAASAKGPPIPKSPPVLASPSNPNPPKFPLVAAASPGISPSASRMAQADKKLLEIKKKLKKI